jgi:hypothetical protein
MENMVDVKPLAGTVSFSVKIFSFLLRRPKFILVI